MEALLSNHTNKYFILMTRITERGVLRINASNFSSLAKPVKRIPTLDCLLAYRDKTNTNPKSNSLHRLGLGTSSENAQIHKIASPRVTRGDDSHDEHKGKECEDPISVERILRSMQHQPEMHSAENSGKDIDGASFLMAEVLPCCCLLAWPK